MDGHSQLRLCGLLAWWSSDLESGWMPTGWWAQLTLCKREKIKEFGLPLLLFIRSWQGKFVAPLAHLSHDLERPFVL